MAKLIVNPTSSSRREIALPRTLLSIGRDPSNDVVLPDAMVSRRHAVIEYRGSQYYIRDCNSSNGSLVNGDRVSERSLRDGDLVAIGTARLLFRDELELEDPAAKVVQHPSAPRLQCPPCQADYRKGDLFCRQCGGAAGRQRAAEGGLHLLRHGGAAARALLQRLRAGCRRSAGAPGRRAAADPGPTPPPADAGRPPTRRRSHGEPGDEPRRRRGRSRRPRPGGRAVTAAARARPAAGTATRSAAAGPARRGPAARRAAVARRAAAAPDAHRAALRPRRPASARGSRPASSTRARGRPCRRCVLGPVLLYWSRRASRPTRPTSRSSPIAAVAGPGPARAASWARSTTSTSGACAGATPGKRLLGLAVEARGRHAPDRPGRARRCACSATCSPACLLGVGFLHDRVRRPRRCTTASRARASCGGERTLSLEPTGVEPHRAGERGLALPGAARGPRARRSGARVWELLHDLSVAVLFCFFLITFVAQAFRVQGTSMLPLLAGRRAHHRQQVRLPLPAHRARRRGGLLVPARPLGLLHQARGGRCPATRWSCAAASLYVNGRRVRGGLPAAAVPRRRELRRRSQVQKGYYYVLGDHRNSSNDSRNWGEVPEKYIYGKAVFRFWPLAKAGLDPLSCRRGLRRGLVLRSKTRDDGSATSRRDPAGAEA